MAGTKVEREEVDRQAALRAFNERLASGRAPEPGEPHSAMEALEAVEAARGPVATQRMREMLQQIHEAEVADARAATQ